MIQKGGTVTYRNLDIVQHNVHFKGGLGWQSPYLGLGQTYKFAQTTTLKKGTYPFVCDLHRNMTGALIVK